MSRLALAIGSLALLVVFARICFNSECILASVAPQSVLDPEGAVQDRIILLGRMHVGPDAAEPSQRAQVRPRDMGLIIPQQAAAQRGPVTRQHETEHQRAHCPWLEPPGRPRASCLHGAKLGGAPPANQHRLQLLSTRRYRAHRPVARHRSRQDDGAGCDCGPSGPRRAIRSRRKPWRLAGAAGATTRVYGSWMMSGSMMPILPVLAS